MKTRIKRLKISGLTVLFLFALAMSGIIYSEIFWLPGFLHGPVRKVLLRQGINAEFKHLKPGVFGSLKITDAVVYDGIKEAAPAMMRARRIVVDTSLSDWWPGNFSPRFFSASDVVISLPLAVDPESVKKAEKIDIEIARFDFAVDTDGTWRVSELDADLLGLRIQGEAVLQSFSEKEGPELELWTRKEPFGWRLLPGLFRKEIQERLIEFKKFCRANQFQRREHTGFKGSLAFDPERPRDLRLSGEINLSGLIYRGFFWPRVEGGITAEQGRWRFHDLHLVVGESRLRGDLEYDWESGKVKANLGGRAEPRTLAQLFDFSWPAGELAGLEFLAPPEVEIMFDIPLDDPKAGRMEGAIESTSLRYGSILLRNLSGKLAYENEALEFSDWRVTPFAGSIGVQDEITGEAVYSLENKLLSARIQGRVRGAVLRRAIRDSTYYPDWLRGLDFNFTPVDFQFHLDDSPLSPEDWRGRAELEAGEFKFRQAGIENLSGQFEFVEGRIKTYSPLVVSLSEPGEEVAFEFNLEPARRQISGRITGGVDFTSLYSELALPSVRQLEILKFSGPPPRFDLTIKPSPLFDPLSWRVEGWVTGEQVEYDGLKMDKVEARAEKNGNKVRFTDIAATLPRFDYFSLDFLEVTLDHPEVRLAGEIVGDPKDVDIFVGRGDARRVFNEVWRDFEWPEKPPRFEIENLHYQRYPDGERRWMVDMQARAVGENIIYRGAKMDHISAMFDLDLPKQARITEIEIRDDPEREDERQDKLDGELVFELGKNPSWQFECRGNLAPVRIFSAVGPGADDIFEDFHFSPQTDLEMNGTVYMRGEGKANISGNFSSLGFEFLNISFGEHDLEWELAGRDLRWRLQNTELHGGQAEGSGSYNTFTRSGYVDFELADVGISELFYDFEGGKPDADLGLLTSSAQIYFQQWDGDSEVSISGNGKVRVREAEFWEAPLLKNLGDALGLGRLGRISELDAKLEFIGDHISVKDLQTDGTILSLQGGGRYYWTDHHVDFLVRGRTLRSTAFLGMVLRPLSWFFEARLKGPINEAEWSVQPLGGTGGSED